MTNRSKGLFMVSFGASMWGGSGVAGQYLLQDCGFSTEWLVVSRMILSGIILLLADRLIYRKSLFSIWHDRKDAWEVLLFAVFGMLAVQYTYFACIKHGNAAAATVLQYLMPVFIIIYITLSTRKLPRLIEIICVFMAMTGTFLLVTHGRLDYLSISPTAIFWGLLSAVAAAFYTVQPKRLIRKWRAPLIIGWGMLIGGIMLMPINPPWQFTGNWTIGTGLIYTYIIIFGTVLAFGCYLGSIKHIQPSEASILGSLEPLSAIILSILFLNTSFGLIDIIGTVLIIGTVFLLAHK
ncbi:MAG: DMT family transporter [Anaerovibrio sp.]|uniref:DMT family transporter n=1 Tax=Anaerovibrio sp. TaxID=1872532 RepID=UPI0025CCC978|nr:EamA family transporter [Anaerovibrio sp.]MCR5175351.1 DMT family transporter [Anaerovibrio sp.]